MNDRLTIAVNEVRAWLGRLSPLPEAELAELVNTETTLQEYRRKQRFTRVGEVDFRLGLVIGGLFRVFYTDPQGRQHVRNFCMRGMPLGAYGCLISGQPSNVDIEALEDSLVLELPYTALIRRFDRGSAWERLGRRIAEEHYVSRERREQALLTLDARGRFRRFQEDFPGLVSRLKRSDIASYIGVRPETLSRLCQRKPRSLNLDPRQ